MKDVLQKQIIEPLEDAVEADEVSVRVMHRIKGILPSITDSARTEIQEILDNFLDADESGETALALDEMQKMLGYLEGYVLLMPDT